MKVTREKNCYCHTCNRWLHYPDVARHRRSHTDFKSEDCLITYTHGDTYLHKAKERPVK